MIHPDTELRKVDDVIGWGVFATRAIPRGTILWALDRLDQRISPSQVQALGPRYAAHLDRYAFLSGTGNLVLCWDLARFVNHSCEANAISTGWDFDIAVRDIAPGDEITNDYGCLNLDESFRCFCRSSACRRTIFPGDFEELADAWDTRVRAAFADLSEVPQPLWKWVESKRAVTTALRNPARLPSIRRHRFVSPRPTDTRVAGRSA